MERKKWTYIGIAATAMIWLAATANAWSQGCTGGTFAGVLTPTVAWQTHPCVKGGEYYEFNGIAGRMYTFAYCFAGGFGADDTQITILSAGGTVEEAFDDDGCGSLESYIGYWMCPANGTYRVLTTRYNCQTSNNCNVLAYKVEPDPTGPGSTCSNPYVISSLPFSASGFGTCGFGDDYNQTHACGSTYMNDEDFVFRFNGTAGQCISIFTDNTFTYSGLFLVRGCPDAVGSTCIAFNEAAGGNPLITNFTLPTTSTYYIVVSGDDALLPDCQPFDIEVFNCVAPGQGATCATAFTIPSLPYNQIGFTTCGRGNTYTSAHACGSPYMDGDDFVFRYASPGNECISIDVTGTYGYTGLFVFDGCPNAGATNCIASRGDPSGDPELRTVNLTAAGTYYIMVSTWPSPQCTPFNFSIYTCGPGCTRNPNSADACGSATLVNLGPNDTVCGVARYDFTPDVSVDLDNDFCGSIENNSWFRFVADSTTMTLQVNVPDCMSGFGIQAQVFQTSNCNTYTPVSNCWNPQWQIDGVVQATGLTVGQSYYLMIDGYAGDDCTFEIFRLIGTPLPVNWSGISAEPSAQGVDVRWSVSSESNVRGYHVQRGRRADASLDGLRWEDVGFVECPGDAPQGRSYSFDDIPPYNGATWYYRIHEVDLDGRSDFSQVVEVNLPGPPVAELRGIFPQPARDEMTLRYYTTSAGPIRVAVMDAAGRMLHQQDGQTPGEGTHDLHLSTAALPAGTYMLMIAVDGKTLNNQFVVAR